jgi:hypothetical protein
VNPVVTRRLGVGEGREPPARSSRHYRGGPNPLEYCSQIACGL